MVTTMESVDHCRDSNGDIYAIGAIRKMADNSNGVVTSVYRHPDGSYYIGLCSQTDPKKGRILTIKGE